MSDKVFLDTNILVYLHSFDEPRKRQTSTELFSSFQCCTSVQALNEFCYVSIKKQRRSRDEIEQALRNICDACQVSSISVTTMSHALKLHETYGYQFFDCLMLASAIENGCTQIMTEDMSSGHIIEQKLTIRNPFKAL